MWYTRMEHHLHFFLHSSQDHSVMVIGLGFGPVDKHMADITQKHVANIAQKKEGLLERIVVTNYIYPAISAPPMVNLVADQFAFRPTGSTTAALIDLLHNITVLLQHNEYVA